MLCPNKFYYPCYYYYYCNELYVEDAFARRIGGLSQC